MKELVIIYFHRKETEAQQRLSKWPKATQLVSLKKLGFKPRQSGSRLSILTLYYLWNYSIC